MRFLVTAVCIDSWPMWMYLQVMTCGISATPAQNGVGNWNLNASGLAYTQIAISGTASATSR